MAAAPPAHTELRRTVHRLMLQTIPNKAHQPTTATLVRLISPNVPGINEKEVRRIVNDILDDPAPGFILSSYGQVQRRLTPAEIYAMHRDMKQHLAASAIRGPSGRPMVECRVFIESMKTLVLTTSESTARTMLRQFYKGVPELFGEEWVEEQTKLSGKTVCGRSLQDLPNKGSIVARNRDPIAALEEGSTAVPFPPPGPRQCQPAHSTEVRDVVHRLMLATVPQTHARPSSAALVQFISQIADIDEKALRSVITTIVDDPASGFVFNSVGQVQRRLTPAEIYAMHRDLKQHLAASTLRSCGGQPMVESRVFIESMKTLVFTTSGRTASTMSAQFYKGVSELFGEQWVQGYVHVRGKKINGRSLQDLPDKASIVARNRDLIAALEEGSTAVPFPPITPTPCNLALQYPRSAELRAVVHRLLLETVPHSILSRSALLRLLSLKVPNTDQVVLRSIVTSVIERPASGFILDAQGRIQRRLTPAEIYAIHGDMKQHLAASALRSGRPMVECRVFIESMQTLVLTTSVKRATRLGAQFYKGVSELFGERWVPTQIKVGGTTTHGRTLQDLPDKASIVARNRDLIAALEEGSTAVPFPPPAPLPAEAPAVAAPAVQRRGRGVAPKRQREAGPSDTEGRRAGHT